MVEKGSTVVGGQGDLQEWGEVMALRQGHAFPGNSSFGCTQRSWHEYWCDVFLEVHRLQNRLHSLDPTRCLQMKVREMPAIRNEKKKNDDEFYSAPSRLGSKKRRRKKKKTFSLSTGSSLNI